MRSDRKLRLDRQRNHNAHDRKLISESNHRIRVNLSWTTTQLTIDPTASLQKPFSLFFTAHGFAQNMCWPNENLAINNKPMWISSVLEILKEFQSVILLNKLKGNANIEMVGDLFSLEWWNTWRREANPCRVAKTKNSLYHVKVLKTTTTMEEAYKVSSY